MLLALCKGGHSTFYQADKSGRVEDIQAEAAETAQAELVPLQLRLTAKLQVCQLLGLSQIQAC